MEQKIKQDINIGANIKAIRKRKKIRQVDLVRLLQLEGVDMTRETLVKIEGGIQHIRASQLRRHGGGICGADERQSQNPRPFRDTF